MALPLPLRNRLAELILESLSDPKARTTLAALVRFCTDTAQSSAPPVVAVNLPAVVGAEFRPFRDEFCERARRAWSVVHDRPLSGPEPGLDETLDAAADLFDARLFFEVHELLEPYWMRAEGATREALRGLIQIAVGFQHLANDNLEGARMLLEEGGARVEGKTLNGRDLTGFAHAVRRARDAVAVLGREASRTFDWARAPRFPRAG